MTQLESAVDPGKSTRRNFLRQLGVTAGAGLGLAVLSGRSADAKGVDRSSAAGAHRGDRSRADGAPPPADTKCCPPTGDPCSSKHCGTQYYKYYCQGCGDACCVCSTREPGGCYTFTGCPSC
jgi:hypothetical protein